MINQKGGGLSEGKPPLSNMGERADFLCSKRGDIV